MTPNERAQERKWRAGPASAVFPPTPDLTTAGASPVATNKGSVYCPAEQNAGPDQTVRVTRSQGQTETVCVITIKAAEGTQALAVGVVTEKI